MTILSKGEEFKYWGHGEILGYNIPLLVGIQSDIHAVENSLAILQKFDFIQQVYSQKEVKNRDANLSLHGPVHYSIVHSNPKTKITQTSING